ncbi:MAG: peptide chain release factor 1 [Clostridiales bacterium]|nr:peptide chain release factor 1 [Clostridiales bacterium]
MLDKLKNIKEKYDSLSASMIDPNITADIKEYTRIAKEYSTLQPIAEAYDKYSKLVGDIKSAQELLEIETDKEMLDLLQAEIKENKAELEKLEEEIKILLLPKDANDDKNVIMEIRSGAGGEESSLFCYVLFRMYSMYAEKMRWKIEVLDMNETELNGIKEVSFMIKGLGAFSKLKYESGVHRVQRVPETESSGRIHTSTSTVAVLPEHEDVDVEINEKDIKIDTYRSSGAGGQHVNTTDSAIRITHFPTGIVVCCQDERSQGKNKDKAFKILKSKLYDYYQMQKDSEYAANRKSQVGTGDRSERIRTYNYPQGRLTDHRINYTEYNLQSFLDGNIDNLIENLRMADQRAKLENMNED